MENTGEATANEPVGDDDDTPMNLQQPSSDGAPLAAEGDNGSSRIARSSRSTGKETKRRPIEEEIEEDEERRNANTVKPPKTKRARLHSPEPVARAVEASVTGDGDDSKEVKENKPESGHSHGKPAAAALPAVATEQNAGDSNAEHAEDSLQPNAQPLEPKLRIVSQQTPGKYGLDRSGLPPQTTRNFDSDQVEYPSRKLVPRTTASDAPSSSFSATTNCQSFIQTLPSHEDHAVAPGVGSETGAAPTQLAAGLWSTAISWSFMFALLHLAIYGVVGDTVSPVASMSDQFLHFYKRNLFHFELLTPPIQKVRNESRQAEMTQLQRERRQQKQKILEEIEDAQNALIHDIKGMKQDTETLDKDLKTIRKQVAEHDKPLLVFEDTLSHMQELLNVVAAKGKWSNSKKEENTISEIMKLLGEKDESKLLDLSSLDLWNIPEVPGGCGVQDDDDDDKEEEEQVDKAVAVSAGFRVEDHGVILWMADERRLLALDRDLRQLVDTSTDEIVKDAHIADQLKKWIRSQLKEEIQWDNALSKFKAEELSKLFQTEEEKLATHWSEGALATEVLLQQIADRLEIEIADQTGRYDYAAIHNGAAVIREGRWCTSPSVRRHLPYFNRLMAGLGLQFFGLDAEEALTPTVPQDTLGQCWAFQSEEVVAPKQRKPKSAQGYSGGTVATLAVRLAKPTFVHSVVIEHPTKEISDHVESALRKFRIVGFEDTTGNKGSYELGRFEYSIGKDFECPRLWSCFVS
jgi:Sad1 / UNC-like C-terminal